MLTSFIIYKLIKKVTLSKKNTNYTVDSNTNRMFYPGATGSDLKASSIVFSQG